VPIKCKNVIPRRCNIAENQKSSLHQFVILLLVAVQSLGRDQFDPVFAEKAKQELRNCLLLIKDKSS